MLTRLYVDNYKCLVNFDLRLGREHLLMGRNGTGKTTVFEVLSALRRLQSQGAAVSEVFPPATLTRWQRRTRQVFELEVSLDGEVYRYRLEVEHDAEQGRSRVDREALHHEGTSLFVYEPGQEFAKFLAQDGQTHLIWPGPERTGLYFFRDSAPWHPKLRRFASWFERLYVVRIDPRRMTGRSEAEQATPAEDLSNFASWYRHLAQERLNEVVRLRDDLRGIFDGFDALILKSGGEGIRMLRALWRREASGASVSASDEYTFDELSEGQRALIGLYTLLHFLSGSGATLCLDEPDNFVALSEIQPFLLALREQEHLQALLISHHPEVINLLAPESGLWFERIANGPVRVGPFQAPPEAAVPAAELVARGWEDGK
ncbi:MAG TPA: ATP-binding protein [Archangium sp.]|uniref:AAA family ATPase n=1 Tax=Archangium sp. TaxID=1872627 RepID=UPI002E330FE5|nr:ATP-binding protein [Archangium sp.]HEX5754489.1 ATP-binding protein [Archangium sp.]